MHDCIMERRVELFSLALDRGYAEFFQGGAELCHDHFHTLAVCLVFGTLLQGALQIVVYRQKSADCIGFDIPVQGVFFLLAAFAEVVVFRTEAQIPVIQGRLLFFKRLYFSLKFLDFYRIYVKLS